MTDGSLAEELMFPALGMVRDLDYFWHLVPSEH